MLRFLITSRGKVAQLCRYGAIRNSLYCFQMSVLLVCECHITMFKEALECWHLAFDFPRHICWLLYGEGVLLPALPMLFKSLDYQMFPLRKAV